MFSLIISIVSIALVVALVAATMYHGGDTLTQGRDRADAAALVSGAQQITGAAAMHLALDSGVAANVQELVDDGYLSSSPAGTWTLTADQATTVAGSAGACAAVNASAGIAAADTADATDTNDALVVVAADIVGTYGCTTADNGFVFNY